jgi:peroxiredoxin
MGKVSFPVTTAVPEAQEFINQGVAQLHSFFYFEAERSFRQAAQLDPQCAIAYWGMAMANVNNVKRARGFVKEARKRAAPATAREQKYIEALEAFYKEGDSDKAQRQGQLLALETIIQDSPDDINARSWLTMVTWQGAGQDGIGSRQAVDAMLDTVFQVDPMHPGAHHYRIHLWDNVKPIRAERSAALYASTAPGIAHAWHMPGHTYTGLKRYADAAYQQEGSARVDHAYMFRQRVMPFEIHNYAHNNQWLCTTLSHLGRVRDAVAVARNLVEQPRDPNKNGPNDGGSPQRSGRLRWAEVLTRYELWDELIAATKSRALDWSEIDLERQERAYRLGQAYAGLQDRAHLTEQIDALKALAAEQAKKAASKNAGSAKAATKSEGSRTPWDLSSPALKSALAELEGQRHLLQGEIGPAFEKFAQATSMRPEALARAHLTARNYGFAETTARQAVEKQENQLPPLAALVEILHAVGKDQDARDASKKLEPLLRSADPDLPLVRRLASWTALAKVSTNGADSSAISQAAGSDDATTRRIDLTTLGPLTWSPFPAQPFAVADITGRNRSLADYRGKNVVVLFFLGGKCAHCMQQLQVFSKQINSLKKLDTEIVALSTDSREATQALKQNTEGIAFPMPLLADPGLEVFKSYRAFDDFENQPLHGTFLIDARGDVRYQRISADPFLDVDFIEAEAARVNRMVKRAAQE